MLTDRQTNKQKEKERENKQRGKNSPSDVRTERSTKLFGFNY